MGSLVTLELLTRLGQWDPSKVSVSALYSLTLALCQLVTTEPKTQVTSMTSQRAIFQSGNTPRWEELSLSVTWKVSASAT